MLWIGIAAVVAIVIVVLLLGRKPQDEPARPAEREPARPPSVRPAAPAESAAPTAGAASAAPAARTSVPPAESPAPAKSARERSSEPPPAAPLSGAGDLAAPEVRATVHDEAKEEIHVTIESEKEDDDVDDPSGPIPMILVTAVGRTDAGKRRKHNEDSYLVYPDENVFVIADGMGGYAAGEVASQLAVDTIASAFKGKKFTGAPNETRPRRGDELVRAIQMANKCILDAARADESKAGMGTTLVAARFSLPRQRVYIAHVGDSRLYRLRKGTFEQLTTDHTLGSLGIVGPSAAKLTRAVGIADEVEVDLLVESAETGDHYVICSDGLSKMISDEVVQKVIQDNPDLDRACSSLIEMANDAGGRDNVTVILIRVERPNLAAKTSQPIASA